MAHRTGHALMFLGALLTLLHELLGPTTMFTSSGVGAKSRAEAEALALKLGLGRPATLKEFLLDNSYVPPAVEYKVASRGKYYVATAVVGGKAYQGAPAETCLGAESSAAHAVLRSLRLFARDNEAGRMQSAAPAKEGYFELPRGRSSRETSRLASGGKREGNLRYIERISGAKLEMTKSSSIKVSG
ncbi:unnamed protein product, partial [Symbiodinium pilosum]